MDTNQARKSNGGGIGGEMTSTKTSRDNVITLRSVHDRRSPLDALTVAVALARLKAGTLEPNVLVALLAGVGILE